MTQKRKTTSTEPKSLKIIRRITLILVSVWLAATGFQYASGWRWDSSISGLLNRIAFYPGLFDQIVGGWIVLASLWIAFRDYRQKPSTPLRKLLLIFFIVGVLFILIMAGYEHFTYMKDSPFIYRAKINRWTRDVFVFLLFIVLPLWMVWGQRACRWVWYLFVWALFGIFLVTAPIYKFVMTKIGIGAKDGVVIDRAGNMMGGVIIDPSFREPDSQPNRIKFYQGEKNDE